MADYELGTAHGRIVVDYDDRGVADAEKSLDRLKAKSRELLSQFGSLARGWVSQARQMGASADDFANKAENVAKVVATISVAAAAVNGPIRNLVPGIKVLKDLREAFGGLPDGAERYPRLVQNIIRVVAAISLFRGGASLLARATRGIAGVSTLTRGLVGFGNILNTLSAPLRVVSSAALGFLTILKGFETVKKYAKYALIFSAGLGTLGVALNVIGGVSQSIKELLGVVGLLPAVLATAGLAAATLKIGLSGIGKAIKSGDLSKLAPQARAFVTEVRALKSAFETVKLDVQNRLFAGLGKVVSDLGGLYLPILQGRLNAVASSFNRGAKDVAAYFNNKDQANAFGKALDSNARTVDNLTKTFQPLVRIIAAVWRVSSPLLEGLTAGLGDAADAAAKFVENAEKTGKLEAWIKRGLNAVGDLYFALRNIGQIFGIIFQGLNGGAPQSFLEWLKNATQAVKDFLLSAQGQQVLADFARLIANAQEHLSKLADVFFTHVLPAIEAFLPFWERMGNAVVDGLVAALIVLTPLFKTLGEILSELAPAIGPIVTAIVFLGTTLLGIGIAVKIASGALAIIRTALLAFKGVEFLVGLLGRLGGGFGLLFRALGPVLRIVKGGLIAGALFEVARGIDAMNLAAVNGDDSKLSDMEQTLHDLIGVWDGLWAAITKGDFQWVKDQWKDIGDEWDQLVKKFKGEGGDQSDAGKFWDTLSKRTQDFWTTTQQTFRDIGSFFSGIGSQLAQGASNFVQPFIDAGTPVVTFFQNLPITVGTAINDFITFLGTKGGEIIDSLVTGLSSQWSKVTDFFSQSWFDIGFQIGTVIGDFLTWGGQMIQNLWDGANQKWAEFMSWLGTLPGLVGEALANFGLILWNSAVQAWEQFRSGAEQKGNEAVEGARQVPGKISEAVSGLVETLRQKAVEAWENFKQWSSQKIDEAVATAQQLPNKVANAITALRDLLRTRAIEAWESFKAAAAAKAEEIFAFARSVPGRIRDAVGNLAGLLVSAGRAVIDGLLAGIKAGVQAMYDFVSGIAAGIAARKGPLPYDRRLLVPAGNAIIRGLITGMQQQMPGLWRTIGAINSDLTGIGGMASSVNLSATGGLSGSTLSQMSAAPIIPTGAIRGGDGAAAGTINNIGKVEIPAKDIREMQDVAEFFSAVQQKSRAGRSR